MEIVGAVLRTLELVSSLPLISISEDSEANADACPCPSVLKSKGVKPASFGTLPPGRSSLDCGGPSEGGLRVLVETIGRLSTNVPSPTASVVVIA